MKVLYLVFTPFPGRASTTVATEGWFRHLQSRGLEPVVACSHPGQFHGWALEQHIPAYHVPLPFPKRRWPWPFFRSLWRLWRIVKRHRIQLIHCNEQDIYPIGQFLARLCHLPIVVSVHSRMNRGFCKWAFSERRRPRRVFFLTQASREVCRPVIDGVVPETDWRLLYNGLDLEHFRRSNERALTFRSEHKLDAALVIGAACALRPGKQLEHLFNAAANLNDRTTRIAVAGGPIPGGDSYARELLKTGKEKLGDRLICLGHLKDLRDFYNGLDLFVNTSEGETCSISIMEALACGCPIVGYPSVSVAEQVLPEGGEIVEQDNIGQLTAALDRWLRNVQRLNAARAGARKRAEDVFDIRKIADQLWNEYQSLLSGKS